MKHIIKIVPWCKNCADGCCIDYGNQLIINDIVVDNVFYEGEKFLIDILKALKITDYEIENDNNTE